MKRTLFILAFLLAAILPGMAQQAEDLTPKKPNIVTLELRDCKDYKPLTAENKEKCFADPATLVQKVQNHNSRTNAGRDWQAGIMGNATAAPCNYIAVSSTAQTPAADGSNSLTTLSGEYTANGFARAQGTYAHTAGTNTYTITYDFTPSGTSLNVRSLALFNAAGPPPAGTMCFVADVTLATFNTGDPVLRATWTVNY